MAECDMFQSIFAEMEKELAEKDKIQMEKRRRMEEEIAEKDKQIAEAYKKLPIKQQIALGIIKKEPNQPIQKKRKAPVESEEEHDRRIIARFNAINEAIVDDEARWRR